MPVPQEIPRPQRLPPPPRRRPGHHDDDGSGDNPRRPDKDKPTPLHIAP